VRLHSATPALPATDVALSRGFYVDMLGFEVVAEDYGFVAVLDPDGNLVRFWERRS
jgi:hypothetical protein